MVDPSLAMAARLRIFRRIRATPFEAVAARPTRPTATPVQRMTSDSVTGYSIAEVHATLSECPYQGVPVEGRPALTAAIAISRIPAASDKGVHIVLALRA